MKLNTPQVTTCPAMNDNWVLTADFRYEGHGVKLTIPRGFVTDLASIPRFLWRVIAPFELSLTAPIVHDAIYRGLAGTEHLTREQTDKLFLAIMTDEKVSWWRRSVAYRGVRMFGGGSWRGQKVQVVQLENA